MFMYQTGFLFARPTFLEGAGSTMDLFGVFPEYNKSETPKIADFWAIYNDFQVTGQDIEYAINNFPLINNVK